MDTHYWLTAQKACPWLTVQLDMTLVVDWIICVDRKTSIQTKNESDQTGLMLRLILFLAGRANHYVPATFCFPLIIINTFHSTEKPQITFI